ARDVCGVGPADSTGKSSPASYWPGGRRPSGRSGRARRNPRDSTAMAVPPGLRRLDRPCWTVVVAAPLSMLSVNPLRPVIATGVRAEGRSEVLGLAVGDSEDGAFWTVFLRS